MSDIYFQIFSTKAGCFFLFFLQKKKINNKKVGTPCLQLFQNGKFLKIKFLGSTPQSLSSGLFATAAVNGTAFVGQLNEYSLRYIFETALLAIADTKAKDLLQDTVITLDLDRLKDPFAPKKPPPAQSPSTPQPQTPQQQQQQQSQQQKKDASSNSSANLKPKTEPISKPRAKSKPAPSKKKQESDSEEDEQD